MMGITNRRRFFRQIAAGSALAATGAIAAKLGRPLLAQTQKDWPPGGNLKISLNVYSFSKLLNDHTRDASAGISLFQLLDFCGRHGFGRKVVADARPADSDSQVKRAVPRILNRFLGALLRTPMPRILANRFQVECAD
jgi:hypothetical protein